jgi:hypothetical protein
MVVGDGELMTIGEGKSMAVRDRADEPVDPDPVVPTVSAN